MFNSVEEAVTWSHLLTARTVLFHNDGSQSGVVSELLIKVKEWLVWPLYLSTEIGKDQFLKK